MRGGDNSVTIVRIRCGTSGEMIVAAQARSGGHMTCPAATTRVGEMTPVLPSGLPPCCRRRAPRPHLRRRCPGRCRRDGRLRPARARASVRCGSRSRRWPAMPGSPARRAARRRPPRASSRWSWRCGPTPSTSRASPSTRSASPRCGPNCARPTIRAHPEAAEAYPAVGHLGRRIVAQDGRDGGPLTRARISDRLPDRTPGGSRGIAARCGSRPRSAPRRLMMPVSERIVRKAYQPSFGIAERISRSVPRSSSS